MPFMKFKPHTRMPAQYDGNIDWDEFLNSCILLLFIPLVSCLLAGAFIYAIIEKVL